MHRRAVMRDSVMAMILVALSAVSGSAALGQCDPAPLSGCRQPIVGDKALLLFKNKGGDGDKLLWKWLKGSATDLADFGDPINSTAYTICIYDQNAGTPGLVLGASVPPGGTCDGDPCWTAVGKGFKFKDPTATNHGISGVLLKFGEDGKAKIIVKGRDAALGAPSLPLAQDPQIVVQLKNEVGICWESTYSAPTIKNETGNFKDKGDPPVSTPTPGSTATATASATATPPGPTATASATGTASSTRTVTLTATRTPTATNTVAGPPSTSTATATLTATRTFTITPTPTGGGGAVCGNGFLEPGETCANCAADCVISPCTAVAPTPSFQIQFTAPLGTSPTSVTVLLGYRSSRVSIPGSGNATTVRQRVTYPAPPPFPQEPNDLNYALRLVVGRSAGIQNGLFATVRFDRCSGAPAPTSADFGCTVEACAGSGGPIAGCTCTVP